MNNDHPYERGTHCSGLTSVCCKEAPPENVTVPPSRMERCNGTCLAECPNDWEEFQAPNYGVNVINVAVNINYGDGLLDEKGNFDPLCVKHGSRCCMPPAVQNFTVRPVIDTCRGICFTECPSGYAELKTPNFGAGELGERSIHEPLCAKSGSRCCIEIPPPKPQVCGTYNPSLLDRVIGGTDSAYFPWLVVIAKKFRNTQNMTYNVFVSSGSLITPKVRCTYFSRLALIFFLSDCTHCSS